MCLDKKKRTFIQNTYYQMHSNAFQLQCHWHFDRIRRKFYNFIGWKLLILKTRPSTGRWAIYCHEKVGNPNNSLQKALTLIGFIERTNRIWRTHEKASNNAIFMMFSGDQCSRYSKNSWLSRISVIWQHQITTPLCRQFFKVTLSSNKTADILLLSWLIHLEAESLIEYTIL